MTCGLPQFAFHTCTAQREVFCSDFFTTATNPLHYSGERWSRQVRQTEAGSDELTPVQKSSDFLDNTQTLASALITSNSLDISVCVFYVSDTTFSPGEFCFLFVIFLFASLTHKKGYNPPPPSPPPAVMCCCYTFCLNKSVHNGSLKCEFLIYFLIFVECAFIHEYLMLEKKEDRKTWTTWTSLHSPRGSMSLWRPWPTTCPSLDHFM